MKPGAHWRSFFVGFVLLLTITFCKLGRPHGGNTSIFLLPPTTPRRIPNIRFYLNQIMHGLVRVARHRGFLITAIFFLLAGVALLTVFHKVILPLLFYNQ